MSGFISRTSSARVIGLLVFLFASNVLFAGDIVPDPQLAGDHSTIPTSDGSIRDDAFADEICDKILKNANGMVKDVKFMTNACYGGGILDDLNRVFGPGGKCEGIKWVGGSASAAGETALAWGDATVSSPSRVGRKLGGTWTDALAGNGSNPDANGKGSMNGGNTSNNVLQDFKDARDTDFFGPKGKKKRSPQVATGNSGDTITWNMSNEKHEAILFTGIEDQIGIGNDIDNIDTALKGVWGSSPKNIQRVEKGTKQQLLNAIDTATKRLDANTQLVIYLGDHGGTSLDFIEAVNGNSSSEISFDQETTMSFDLGAGWYEGFWGNYMASFFPNPLLYLTLVDPVAATAWQIFVNGGQLTGEITGTLSGQVSFFIPFTYLLYGHNELLFVPSIVSANKAVTPLRLSQLEMDSGPINRLLADQILVPGQSAAYFDPARDGEGVFVELLDNQQAVVYMFTYLPDGSGQAWFIGIGQQSGNGIIVTDVLMPTGGKFGPAFNPADVTNTSWGSMALILPACGSGAAGNVIASPIPGNGFEHFENYSYKGLTTLADCPATAKAQPRAKATGSGLSGSWFDPTHNGEGIIVEVLTNGSAVVQWFTYDLNGKQFWIQGTGTFTGSVLTVDNLFSTSGASWGVAFDPMAVVPTDWGTLTMDFTACDAATVDYNSTAGFGTGTLNMVRLTSLMGIPCS